MRISFFISPLEYSFFLLCLEYSFVWNWTNLPKIYTIDNAGKTYIPCPFCFLFSNTHNLLIIIIESVSNFRWHRSNSQKQKKNKKNDIVPQANKFLPENIESNLKHVEGIYWPFLNSAEKLTIIVGPTQGPHKIV